MASVFRELQRRNVARAAIAYVAASWLVVQVIETVRPAFGYSPFAIRVLIILLAIGFLPAMVFAWVFEITPDGLRRERDIGNSGAKARYSGKTLDRAIMVALALAVGVFAVDKFVLDPARDAARETIVAEQARSDAVVDAFGTRSIAVLPFLNMSADPAQEYFSDGITEEILNLLARVRELRVISRSSSFSFKNQDIDIPAVARQLDVAHVLEGSVRKAGERVRITAQLIEARTDTQLWSETYDRTVEDVFDTQADIAEQVVAQLKVELLRGNSLRVRHTDPKAYAAHLRARYVRRQNTGAAFENAIELYQEALAIDPDYPPAWEGLAEAYVYQALYGFRPIDEAFTLAREGINNALAIDPQFGAGVAGLGWIAVFYEQDTAAAARYFKRAYELDPTDLEIISGVAFLAESIGQVDTAIAFREYAVSRDPMGPVGHVELAYSYIIAGRYEDAIENARDGLALQPDHLGARTMLGLAMTLNGDVSAGLAEIEQEPSEVSRLDGLALAHAIRGDLAESRTYLQMLVDNHADEAAFNIAGVYAMHGDNDAAFEWLDKARLNRDPGLSLIAVRIWLRNMRDDPRWQPFLASLGKSDEQLAEIEFDVELPEQ